MESGKSAALPMLRNIWLQPTKNQIRLSLSDLLPPMRHAVTSRSSDDNTNMRVMSHQVEVKEYLGKKEDALLRLNVSTPLVTFWAVVGSLPISFERMQCCC